MKELEGTGILYMGTGVSGGEEGALHGPSIMPGGNPEAWPLVKPILQAIAAQAPTTAPLLRLGRQRRRGPFREDGPQRHRVCRHADDLRGVLPDGAAAGHDAGARCAEVFAEWNQGELNSYLIEITADILAQEGSRDRQADRATSSSIPRSKRGPASGPARSRSTSASRAQTIADAVFARMLSALKNERVAASAVLKGPAAAFARRQEGVPRDDPQGAVLLEDLLLRPGIPASPRRRRRIPLGSEFRHHRAALARRLHHPGAVPRQDQGGVRARPRHLPTCCSIRISPASCTSYQQALENGDRGGGRPTGSRSRPSSSALSYFDSYRSAVLPANLLQAQRDYFGAHTYQRIDKEGIFHTNGMNEQRKAGPWMRSCGKGSPATLTAR